MEADRSASQDPERPSHLPSSKSSLKPRRRQVGGVWTPGATAAKKAAATFPSRALSWRIFGESRKCCFHPRLRRSSGGSPERLGYAVNARRKEGPTRRCRVLDGLQSRTKRLCNVHESDSQLEKRPSERVQTSNASGLPGSSLGDAASRATTSSASEVNFRLQYSDICVC